MYTHPCTEVLMKRRELERLETELVEAVLQEDYSEAKTLADRCYYQKLLCSWDYGSILSNLNETFEKAKDNPNIPTDEKKLLAYYIKHAQAKFVRLNNMADYKESLEAYMHDAEVP